MNEWLQYLNQFHFLRPWWLLGMVPMTMLVVFLWKRRAAYGSWERVISPHLLPHLMKGFQARQNRSPLILLLVCWLLACIALAGPTWRKLPQAVQKKINAQVIVLDLSLSMFATDMPPSRLIRARLKLTDILKRTHEGLTALVVYAGTPHVVTPLTDDTNTILSMVQALSPDIMPIRGSDPVAAIKKALEVLKQGGMSEGRILLMTDNVPANFASQLDGVISRATPVSILGIGTTEGAPIELPDGTFVKGDDGNIVVPRLNIDNLKQAARSLGGRFSTLSATDEDINYLLASNGFLEGNEIKDTHREFDVWDESGPWLVVLMLPFAAAGYRRGWLGALLLPLLAAALLATPRPAAAFGWQDLWKTPDQQGQQLLRGGDPKAAAEKFSEPAWKGASYYKSKNYEAAAKAFGEQPGADAQYNLGNALAHQQKYDDAIAAYQKALKQNPDDKDAKFNLDLVKKLKQQQQNNQGKNGKDNKQDNQKDKDKKKSNQDQSQSDQDKQDQDKQNQDQQDQKNQQGQDKQKQDQNDRQQQDKQSQDQQDKQQNQQQQQQSEKDQKQDQKQNGQKPQDEDGKPDKQPEQTENEQALEQWLRRVPDDPGGLLRRKFEMESQLRKNQNDGVSTW